MANVSASTSRTRTDLDANLMGLPAALRTRSAAFASSAAPSITPNGGSRCSVAARRCWNVMSDSGRLRVRGKVDRKRLQCGLGRITVPVDQIVQRQAVEDGDHLPGQDRLGNVPDDVSDLRNLSQAEQHAFQVPAVLMAGDLAPPGIPQYRRGDLVQDLMHTGIGLHRFPVGS